MSAAAAAKAITKKFRENAFTLGKNFLLGAGAILVAGQLNDQLFVPYMSAYRAGAAFAVVATPLTLAAYLSAAKDGWASSFIAVPNVKKYVMIGTAALGMITGAVLSDHTTYVTRGADFYKWEMQKQTTTAPYAPSKTAQAAPVKIAL